VSANTSKLEHEIDLEFYQIYELSSQEIEIVESTVA